MSSSLARRPLTIGALAFERMDQIDLTGPFEVLSQLPDSTYTIYGSTTEPLRDCRGLLIQPDAVLADAPDLDVLHIPGGPGQQALMYDTAILSWLRHHASAAGHVLSVCTGALLLGAAGLLIGRRATTHWASLDLLPSFGAQPTSERVIIDGTWVFASGVTAGIDGALVLASILRGREVAEEIQLEMQYAPEPPFDSGLPETAPAEVLGRARQRNHELAQQRQQTAAEFALSHEIAVASSREGLQEPIERRPGSNPAATRGPGRPR